MVLEVVVSTESTSVLDVASATDGLFSLYLSVDAVELPVSSKGLELDERVKLEDTPELVVFR